MTLAVATPAGAALTEGPRLAAIYDSILARALRRGGACSSQQTCPPAPVEACQALAIVAIWWQILLDPDSRAARRPARNEPPRRPSPPPRRGRAASRAAPKRGSTSPAPTHRWCSGACCAASGLLPRATARKSRTRSSARSRSTRTLHDAYFGIGLYHYYADVAPAALKVVRWLLLLPGGDRVQGLREMLQARERGELLAGEADFQLHWLYLWYEQQAGASPEAAAGSRRALSVEPVFLQRIAEVQHEYFHDHRASGGHVEDAAGARTRRQVSAARLAEVRARLGLAAELIETSMPDRAIGHLTAVIALQPTTPYAALALAHLQLGDAYDRLGRRDLASAAYQAALAHAPERDSARVRARARAGLRNVTRAK